MGTTKSRKSRRNNSRPTAFSFLSNIALGTEDEKPPDESIQSLSNYNFSESISIIEESTQSLGAISLHSTDSSFSADEDASTLPLDSRRRSNSNTTPPFITQDVQHHKLTREDSERPIASEKIKKKSFQLDKEEGSSLSIMSVFRYYTDKIRQSTGKKKEHTANRGYVQQQLENNDRRKHRKALSYAHFLDTTGSLADEFNTEEILDTYSPFFLDDDAYGTYGLVSSSWGSLSAKPADIKREVNEQFRLAHPEITSEITLSKIRAIKHHLLEISKQVDLEVSSLAHAFVYFEKLVIKNIVTKKNRKLIAACCLFLASKVNEAKGTWFGPLLEAIDDELNIDAKEIHEHEFAVFADLEFNLYVPRREFMPHFERILSHLENKSIQEYLGHSNFFEINQRT